MAQLTAIATNSGGQYFEITKAMIDAAPAGTPVPELVRAANIAISHGFMDYVDCNRIPAAPLPYGPQTEFQVTSPVVGTVNLKGMTEQATLPLVKAEWLANQTTANRDFVALAGRAMGGISYGPGIGNTWGYTVQPSELDGNFWVYLRHELAHNMNVGHADGGGPEGETINGRNNNGYARLSTSELEVMLNYRDSVIAQYDNDGTFTAINIPPYACAGSR